LLFTPNTELALMSDVRNEAGPPVKRVGPRRVRTEPREGQVEEPDVGHEESHSGENDQRLRADKPPHY
jgi:hypothetical protein